MAGGDLLSNILNEAESAKNASKNASEKEEDKNKSSSKSTSTSKAADSKASGSGSGSSNKGRTVNKAINDGGNKDQSGQNSTDKGTSNSQQIDSIGVSKLAAVMKDGFGKLGEVFQSSFDKMGQKISCQVGEVREHLDHVEQRFEQRFAEQGEEQYDDDYYGEEYDEEMADEDYHGEDLQGQVSQKEFLDSFTLNEVTSLGPDVPPSLGRLANKFLGVKMEEESHKKKIDLYKIPANVSATLTVPKLNNPIFENLAPHKKKVDINLQKVQKDIQLAAVPIMHAVTNLLEARDSQDKLELDQVIHNLTDSLAFLGCANSGMLEQRRENLKFDLPKNLQALTKEAGSSENWLFGDDLGSKIKELNELNRLNSQLNRGTGRGVFRPRAGRRVSRFSGSRPYTRRPRGGFGGKRPLNRRGPSNPKL